MTGTEMITDFKLEGATVRELMKAINAHLKRCGIEAEDRDFGVDYALETWENRNTAKVPDRRTYRWLVAFAIEGDNEGYYIHVGAMTWAQRINDEHTFLNFGHAKCYSADQAYAIAREAQRFLTAAAWN